MSNRQIFRVFFFSDVPSATMVTAILPSIVAVRNDEAARSAGSPATGPSTSEQQGAHHSMSPSLSSELTITPARLARMPIASKDSAPEEAPSKPASPTLLAGFVGLFTGCGALLALAVFLPLPARLQAFQGVSPAQAVRYSYYVVGCIAFLVAIGCLLGLRSLAGENGHRRKNELGVDDDGRTGRQPGSSSRASRTAVAYRRALFDAAILGFGDSRIGLGYVGGFVARFVLALHHDDCSADWCTCKSILCRDLIIHSIIRQCILHLVWPMYRGSQRRNRRDEERVSQSLCSCRR